MGGKNMSSEPGSTTDVAVTPVTDPQTAENSQPVVQAARKEGIAGGLRAAGIAVLAFALIQTYFAGTYLLPISRNVWVALGKDLPWYVSIAFKGTDLLARWCPLIVLAVVGLFFLYRRNSSALPRFVRGPLALIAGGGLLAFSSASIIAGFIMLAILMPNLVHVRWTEDARSALSAVYTIRRLEDEYRAANPAAGFTCDLQALPEHGAGLPRSYAFRIDGCQGKPVSHYVVIAEPPPDDPKSGTYFSSSKATYCADQDGRLGFSEKLNARACVVGVRQQ
jgi:hypothetical protein